MDKLRDERKRHPRPHFSEESTLNTFLKKDTCKMKKKKKKTISNTVALEPASFIST